MSSELAVIDVTKDYLAFSDENLSEVYEANLGRDAALRESDLTRIGIPPAGGLQWRVPGINGDEYRKSIDGILVYHATRGVIWATSEPSEGSMPALVSRDLRIAKLTNPHVPEEFLTMIEPARLSDGTYAWPLLPQTQWGSARDGRGKVAREQHVLYVLPKNEPLPVVVTVTPASLKNWRRFILSLSKLGIPYYRSIISLTLEASRNTAGIAFSRVNIGLLGVLTPEQGELVRQKFTAVTENLAASSF